MSPSNDDTQPVRRVQSGPGCLRRLVQLLVLAILAVGIFAVGYATGSDVEILTPAKTIIETAVALLPELAEALSTRSPQATYTPLPTLDPAEVSRMLTPTNFDVSASPTWTAVPPSVTPIPTATEPPPTQTTRPTDTPLPTATQPPPTPTSIPAAPACYPHEQAWITGDMNVRNQPSTNASKVGAARAGESYPVLESRQGDSYCWLRINTGWMAKTVLVSSSKPQQQASSSADSGVRQALANLNALVAAPENLCSPYDSDSYPYSQSVEAQIVARMGVRIYGPYSGATLSSTRETDIEHILAKSEAHDSGL